MYVLGTSAYKKLKFNKNILGKIFVGKQDIIGYKKIGHQKEKY